MLSGKLGRMAISQLRLLVPTGNASRKLVQARPAAAKPVSSESPSNTPSPDTKPRMLARHLPPLLLVLLASNELHTWRTPTGLSIAFGMWLFRTFVHLRQGAFILKNTEGLRPLRFWVGAEVAVVAASSSLLALNAIAIEQPTLRGLTLFATALSMVFIARCERLKIVDEQEGGDIRFESGTEWLMNHPFNKTLSMKRVAPRLGRFRFVVFIVNVVSLAAMSAFFPTIPATEYAAFIWAKNPSRASHKSATSNRVAPSSTDQAVPPSSATTYDDICLKTHKGVEPGAGAPTSVEVELRTAFYDGGPGERYTGCFKAARLASPSAYYQLGFDEQSGTLKSVIIATQGCPTSLTWGDDTASFRALLDSQIPLCPDPRHAVGPGDVRFLTAPNGTYVFVRPDGMTAYTILSPGEASAWVSAEGRLSRWLWPIRKADGLLLEDQTTAPVDFEIVDSTRDVVLIQDGKTVQHFSARDSRWADVRSFAEGVR